MRRRLGLAALFAASSLVVACSGGAAHAPTSAGPTRAARAEPALQEVAGNPKPGAQLRTAEPGVEPSSVGTTKSRLDVTLEGQVIPLRNGGRVSLGDGLAVEMFLDPYPPTTLRAWLDLYLTQAGQPITNAEVMIDYDMTYMAHGPFKAAAKNLGDGHYLFTLDYLMYGAWDQRVTFRLPEQQYELPVGIIAYP